MPEDRRLAAIMFTDIVGYTALMGKDEDRAFQLLRKNRDIQRPIIKKYRGEWLKEMGDGILASFHAASDAVRCAGELQRSSQKVNIPLRIGLHEGEVVFESGDVLGDGVNVASRLEELAGEGCIYISGTVYNEIKNKEDIHAHFIREEKLKNVDEPVKIYQVTCEESAYDTSPRITADLSVPKKKSIIVLPFVDISPDLDNEYFSDGLTEEIITDLSFLEDLRVISRNSAMTYKSTKKKTKEIAEEVGVRYVLEGSVRKAGNNLRIVAQLIDADTDTHLWAEKYRGTLDDIFDIQEKVSRSIVDALHLKLSFKENKKIGKHPINNVKAYELHLKAHYEIMLVTKESSDRAIRFINNGMNMIGENEILLADLGLAYLMLYVFYSKEDKNYLKIAEECIHKIFIQNPESSIGHSLKGNLHLRRGQVKIAMIEFQKALALDPNEQGSLFQLGWFYTLAGRGNEARSFLLKLVEIDPLTPINRTILGAIEFLDGRFESGLKHINRAQELEPENPLLRFWVAMGMAYTHHIVEACQMFDRIKRDTKDHVFATLGQFFKYALTGDKEKALKAVTEEMKNVAKEDEMYPIWMAECYSMIGKKKEAIGWLIQGIDYGFLHYPWLSDNDPFLENIRGESRFKKLMEQVKHEWENFVV